MTEELLCAECRELVNPILKTETLNKEIKGTAFKVTSEFAYCPNCEKQIYEPTLHDKYINNVKDSYREQKSASN